jgi:diadenosine tetraphosphate (Ap4A) HIT family hydrolase
MTEEKDCPFCNPSEQILRENKTAQVILSNPHKVPGHFLVVSKRHVEKPWELTQKELQDIFELIFFVEQRIIGMLGDGCDIRQNYRPFQQSKIKIDHVHFHVIPRSHEDYLYKIAEQYESDLFVDLDDMERDAVANILK